ncbi:multiple sugar transport system substrate-binding protein [Paenibacillus sp. yr247]|uniref:extracellular solute-binding protein n=1 Tax=Paenibacillus sp. yr247 TaxID=1761880 RepID=UPI000884C192|nr:extracellular solute-binding protein [Paenibacillus sp. yr247]SDM83064.1 multiple sugar transport system substrate-binding protein [Paenibacillus sp. yr247]
MARQWVSLVLLLLLATGCGQFEVISDPDKVEVLHGKQNHIIEFWHTYSDEETRLLEDKLVPEFERQYPAIQVKTVRQTSNEELKNTLIARASSMRGPDAVRMDIVWVPEFLSKGLLVPLNPFPEFESIRNKLRGEVMDIGLNQGQYFSLPMNINTKIAIYNRKLLNKANLSEPPSSLEAAFKLAREHYFTIGVSGLDTWSTLPYIHSLGGELTNETYTKSSGYLNGPGTIRAVERLLSLYKEGTIENSILTGDGDNWDGVKGGNVLMMDDGPWFYSVFNGQALDKAIQTTIRTPMPHDNGPASIIGGENLVIMKGSKQPEDAWIFVKWLTGVEAQLVMAQTGLIPSNMDAYKALTYQEGSYIQPYVEALDYAFVRPPLKNWTKIDEVYTRYMRNIFQGDLSVVEGLTRAAAEIDGLLIGPDH